MRHAISNLNENMREMRNSFEITNNSELNSKEMLETYFNTALDPQSRDAVLSKKGVGHALNQRELVKSLGIRYILTSPMRRALHSAILSGSGVGEKVKIILLPILREQITYKNTVASTLDELKLFVA